MSTTKNQGRGERSRLHLSGETVERIVEEFRQHILKTRRAPEAKRDANPGGARRTSGSGGST